MDSWTVEGFKCPFCGQQKIEVVGYVTAYEVVRDSVEGTVGMSGDVTDLSVRGCDHLSFFKANLTAFRALLVWDDAGYDLDFRVEWYHPHLRAEADSEEPIVDDLVGTITALKVHEPPLEEEKERVNDRGLRGWAEVVFCLEPAELREKVLGLR